LEKEVVKKILVGGVLFLLFGFNLVLLLQNLSLKQQLLPSRRKDKFLTLERLPSFSLPDSGGNLLSFDSILKKQDRVLLVFFSPTDCPACLAERYLWDETEAKVGISVILVGSHFDRGELWRWVRSSGLTMPVLWDSAGSLVREIGLRTSPLKVLVNSEGRVLWTDPTRLTEQERESYWADLARVLRDS